MTDLQLVFVNPFGDPNVDHQTTDPLCLALVHVDHPMSKVIEDFFEVAILAIEQGNAAAFFSVRQVAELSLKGLIGPSYTDDRRLRSCHDLEVLLAALGPDHDLFKGTGEYQDVIVAFIRKLAEIDPKGDEGRFPTTVGGQLSLGRACCANKDLLRLYTGALYAYAIQRVAW